MMGHSHATSGALAWATACVAAPHVAGVHPSGATIGVGVFATAGAALLPDLDHPEATIAHTLGPVSRAFCRMVNDASGGHRHGTHTLVCAVIAGLVSWPLVILGAPWAGLSLLFMLLALAIRALHLAPGLGGILAAGVTAAVGVNHVNLAWLPAAIGIGSVTHILGDCLTVEGCPALWPLQPMYRHVRLPLLGHAGSLRETLLFSPVMSIATAALIGLHAAGH